MGVKFSRVLETFSTLVETNDGDLLIKIGGSLYSFKDDVNIQNFYDSEPIKLGGRVDVPPYIIERFVLKFQLGQEYSFSLSGSDFVHPQGDNCFEVNLPLTQNMRNLPDLNTVNLLKESCPVDLDNMSFNIMGSTKVPDMESVIIGTVLPLNFSNDEEVKIEFNPSFTGNNSKPKEKLKEWFSTHKGVDDIININQVKWREYHDETWSPDIHKERLKRAISYGERYGTCDRLRVGAVIYQKDNMVAMGFNTANSNKSTCDDKGHLMVNGSCKRTIHAEVEALIDLAKNKIDLEDLVLYCSHKPCIDCIKLIDRFGIKTVYYASGYNSDYSGLDLDVEIIYLEV